MIMKKLCNNIEKEEDNLLIQYDLLRKIIIIKIIKYMF